MKKIFWWWIIVISLMIIGIGLIIYGSNIDENLEGDLYRTDFSLKTKTFNDSSGKSLIIDDWNFFYDFSKNKGNVSFKLFEENRDVESIRLELPKGIKNNNFDVYSIKNNTKIEIKAYKRVIQNSTILVSRFEENFTGEEIIMEFKLKKLSPKGRFQFNTVKYNYLDTPSQKGNVHFILGKEYGCITDCIANPKFIEENIYSVGEDIRLNFKMEDNYSSEIKLNAYSKRKVFWENFWIAIGISLLVSSIFLILSLFSPKRNL